MDVYYEYNGFDNGDIRNNWSQSLNFGNVSFVNNSMYPGDIAFDVPFDDVLQDVHIYLTVAFVLIGTVGNILSLVAVTNRHCKKSSFTVFVAALAIADVLALYATTATKLLSFIFNRDILVVNETLCKLIKYFEYLAPQISSWFVVCLTVERCLCTSFPHKTMLISRPKSGCIVISTISGVLVALNAHILYGYILLKTGSITLLEIAPVSTCATVDAGYENFFTNYWTWIDFTAYCLLPFAIIVVANSITVAQVYRSTAMVTSTVSATSGRRNRQLLLTTLLISTSFIMLGMPQPLLDVLRFEEKDNTVDLDLLSLKIGVLFSVFNYMKTLNHTVNFFLYVLSGTKFRQNLKAAFCKPTERH